jgi:hypothetical protein
MSTEGDVTWIKKAGNETDHSHPSSAEVKNERSYASIPPCLHGVHTDKFYLNLQRKSYAEMALSDNTDGTSNIRLHHFLFYSPPSLSSSPNTTAFAVYFRLRLLSSSSLLVPLLFFITFSLFLSSYFLLVMFPLRSLAIQKVLLHHVAIIDGN